MTAKERVRTVSKTFRIDAGLLEALETYRIKKSKEIGVRLTETQVVHLLLRQGLGLTG